MLTHTRLSSLFVLDQDEALDFYVGVLGMEVRTDADLGFMRWLTVGVPGDPDREILLERPGPPSMDEETAAQVRDLLTRGAAGGWVALATDDAQAAYDALVSRGVDVTDEISVKDYGTDFGIRDPFGNKLRIGQMSG
ncbi:VOC family protein [Nocardioides carbamazepini]|uniref:VOC family protein n=1 Tax=Nocardioides carbamazepini TaxID=2854259 RepID=UPI002149F1CE|nr:VOC family protein [Nocardioides carbamazepini]MCR1782639.1 VOC family protein [Nocardioides carbamazepini]